MAQEEETRQSNLTNSISELDLDRIVRENRSNDEIRHLESELRMTLEEIARLQKSLADANMKISALQNRSASSIQDSIQNQKFFLSWEKDFRQNLETIQAYCRLLLNESVGLLGSLQQKYIERISNSIDSLQKMISEMTQTPNIDHSSGQQQVEFFTASDLLDPVLNSVSEKLRAKQVTLSMDIDDELPDLSGDREILEQILQMLLSNAVLASEDEGSVQIIIQKEMVSGKENILLKVQNAGTNVPQEEMEQLFTYHLQDTDNPIPGMGLLPKDFMLLKMLVEEQYGKIDLVSDTLQGTIFTVRLPLIETR